MKRLLQQNGFFIFLTPLLYVLHITFSNYYYISFKDVLLAALLYSSCFALMYFIVQLFFKQKRKAVLLIFAVQCVFFFFSNFHSGLKNITNHSFVSRYIFLLPFLFVVFFLFIIWLKKTKGNFESKYLQINTVVILLLLSDIFLFAVNHLGRNKINPLKLDNQLQFRIPDSLKRNFYFLIYDAYANSAYLNKRFGFINPLDSFLTKEGFYVYSKSRSNYNFTHFSIASALNMKYFNGLRFDSISKADYTHALEAISKNRIVKIFEVNGFQIINLSIFDIDNYPAFINSDYLPKGMSLFNRFTFLNHVFEDIGWQLFDPENPRLQQFVYFKLNKQKRSNQIIEKEIDHLLQEPLNQPRFIYAHYNMPHPPYFFDSTGKDRPVSVVYKELRNEAGVDSNYLPHLVYTNKKIKETIQKIMLAEKGNAVIIIAGDHGNREPGTKDEMFENFTAIYLPAPYREKLKKDSISFINVFPNVLNAAYGQHIQFVPDSSFFLRDAPTLKW